VSDLQHVTMKEPTAFQDALSKVAEMYEIPDDDLVGEVLIPAMKCADEVRIGAGFFSSHCLAQVAPGLADFISTSIEPLRLLISPAISQEDRQAIESATRTPEAVVAKYMSVLFEEATLSEAKVARHAVECLAYLLAAERLDLRFVLMPSGQYHKKKWLIRSGDDWLAVHGSGNATTRGLLVNGEQMTIDRPWSDGSAAQRRVSKLLGQWNRQWNNEHRYSLTLTATQALKFLATLAPSKMPTVSDFWDAWTADNEAGLEPDLPPNVSSAPSHLLRIPRGLEWRTGTYAHQGQAVDRFLQADGRGVLAIATGGGKTRTALIAATEIQNMHRGPMLVVILVPTTPLMRQWSADVDAFGLAPVQLSHFNTERRGVKLQEIRASLDAGQRTEVVVLSNSLFAQDRPFRDFFDSMPAEVAVMLIGDEMHNLGSPTFVNDPPERADFRLGLSATPIRQYDPDGTDQLFQYFGPEVFEFSLGDAIAAGCLVPYNYHLHEVHLDDDEMDRYVELTEKLRTAGFVTDDNGQTGGLNERCQALLRDRRSVLEHADAKIASLRVLLELHGPTTVSRTLIYASGKKPPPGKERQITLVNKLLSELAIVSHQFTGAETQSASSRSILDKFGEGDYQVLTAMKVLDEGVDIPQTDTAYVLASSTVRREWIQRRGRILRSAPGKVIATLHDFFVVPPDPSTKEGRAVLRGELARAVEFASLATNEWDADGPRELISRFEDLIWTGGSIAT
jgi:superfamily II DNA or RNA helicase